jgi:uncharacterized membrane protein
MLALGDGVFAIAMTLLVVSLGVPDLAHAGDEHELLDALNDQSAELISFFISFAVIGRYWVAHHQFIRLLRAADYGLIWLTLVYLAFIAFLPYPTALLGEYFENPISVVVYALNVGIVSGIEVLLFRHAQRHDLLERAMPEPVFRWGVAASTVPVAFLLGSVPVAFLSTTLAVVCWFLAVPAGLLLNRVRPPEAADWF